MPNEIFAGHYELLEEAPKGAGGRLFEARDTRTNENVAVKVFNQPLLPNSAERADLEDIFARAQRADHPHIVRYHELSLDEGYIVREWMHGFSFLELLRRRRELPGEEAVCLLDGIAGAIDFAAGQGLAPTGGLLGRLFVGLNREVSPAQLVRWRGEPVAKWPLFMVKLNPLSVANFLPTSEADAMNTVVQVSGKSDALLSPPVAFAHMFYELLGGPHLVGRPPRFRPLAALNEAGNATLRQVIEGRRTPANCETLWKELLATSALVPVERHPSPPSAARSSGPPPLAQPQMTAPTMISSSPPPPTSPPPVPPRPASPPSPPPAPPAPASSRPAASPPPRLPEPAPGSAAKPPAPPPLPARRQLRIADALLSAVQPGTMLKLIPSDITNVPVHVIARPQFKIGRSLYQADFIARVLPETPENEKLTKEIGRVHVTAELKGGRLVLFDGNGAQPSVNGSSFGGATLSAERPTPLEGPGMLALFKNYELDVLPLLTAADTGWDLANEAAWPGPGASSTTQRGAVVFTPRRNQPMLRKAVWLFTRLDFTLGTGGEIVWVEAGSPQSGATFFHHRGQFWLANFALPEPPNVAGTALSANVAAPLVSGQSLVLGPGRYTVEVQ
jgi:hypothetical protein